MSYKKINETTVYKLAVDLAMKISEQVRSLRHHMISNPEKYK